MKKKETTGSLMLFVPAMILEYLRSAKTVRAAR